jgi:hypothetical protein
LDKASLEHFFGWDAIAERMGSLKSQGVQTVLLAGLGKNVFAYVRGARKVGVQVLGIADDRFDAGSRRYRRIPVLGEKAGISMGADVVVISDMAPVHAARRAERIREAGGAEVVNWTRVMPPNMGTDEVLTGPLKPLEGHQNADVQGGMVWQVVH